MKTRHINNYDKQRKSLIEKIKSVGGLKYFSEPVKVMVNPFGARLDGKFEPKEVSIIGLSTILGHLSLNAIDAGSVGVCVGDFYDGNEFKKLEDAIYENKN
jgi:hypothetical protein